MSGVGQCWDNAVADCFFGTLKEEIDEKIFASREHARAEIFRFIEIWYNCRRRHSTLGYLSPR